VIVALNYDLRYGHSAHTLAQAPPCHKNSISNLKLDSPNHLRVLTLTRLELARPQHYL
jgi:hypothetical protein